MVEGLKSIPEMIFMKAGDIRTQKQNLLTPLLKSHFKGHLHANTKIGVLLT